MGFIARDISSPHLENWGSSQMEKRRQQPSPIPTNRVVCRVRTLAAYCAGCAGVAGDGNGKTVCSSGTDIGGG